MYRAEKYFEKGHKPGRLTRFMWWSAGADAKLLEACSYSDHAKYFGLGGIVVATGLLATISGGYAFYTIFSPKEIDPQIQYFWRIDSVVGNKVIKGDTWSFGGVETVDLYDYSKPIKRLPMADEYQLHKELESSDLKQVSKEQLLVIYQRFWWSENQKRYDALLKTKESLKEGDKNLQIIDDRLKDFLKMEGEFIQSEAKKILTRAEYERLIKYL